MEVLLQFMKDEMAWHLGFGMMKWGFFVMFVCLARGYLVNLMFFVI